jgi:transposase
MVILASAGGNSVPVIARLMQADEDSVRQVIHRFNEMGLGCLDPQWAGGRPRRISPDDEAFIVTTATTRPETLGQPFTRWSVRKLADYLAHNRGPRRVVVGRERLPQFLRTHGLTFQRTKTWKESNLDSRSGAELLGFLRRAVDEMAQTIVMVTHDPVAAAHADAVVFLADGRIVDHMADPTVERVLDTIKQLGS